MREYLTQLLRYKGLSQDQAQTIAAKWTFGSGKELRLYPFEMYRQVFGPNQEEVWSVYMAVKPAFYRKDREREPDTSFKCKSESGNHLFSPASSGWLT